MLTFPDIESKLEDLDAERPKHFFGCTKEVRLSGIVGLEIFGPATPGEAPLLANSRWRRSV